MGKGDRDYDWVTDRLAVGGSLDSIYDVRKAESDGITHVLNLRTNQDEVPWVLKVGLQYASNPTKDKDENPKPPEWFKGSLDVIGAAMVTEGAKILVHCQEGLNRAPSTVYFFLRTMGFAPDVAAGFVTDARPQAKGKMRWNDDAEAALKQLGYAK